jgi:hypothetical protein
VDHGLLGSRMDGSSILGLPDGTVALLRAGLCTVLPCALPACPLFEAAGQVAGLVPRLQTLGAAALGWTAVPASPYLEPWQC